MLFKIDYYLKLRANYVCDINLPIIDIDINIDLSSKFIKCEKKLYIIK